MSNVLKFNLVSTVVPVTLQNGETFVEYELREMRAADRDTYLDTVSDRLRLDANGKPAGIKKFDGMQADLVSRCLFSKADGKPVKRDIIQGWPSSVVQGLYSEAQKLNKLNVDEEKVVGEAKKD